jgi:hypothetical protein
MTGLPIVPLVALGLLFFATPIIVLVLVLMLPSLRSKVRRLETLARLERHAGVARAGVDGTVEPRRRVAFAVAAGT